MRTQRCFSWAAFSFSLCVLAAASTARAQGTEPKREHTQADQEVRHHIEEGTKAASSIAR
jgi:hypothetical protein